MDCVDGEDGSGRLYPNTLIRFILGYANYYDDDVHGIVNGFRIYSPDGATWGSTYWDTLGTLAWQESFDFWFGVYTKSITGSGADSIKFVGITWYGDGLPDGFDDTAIALMIGPIPPEDVGKTICLDSSSVGGANDWVWSSSDGYTMYYPTWYGPSCFEVTAPGVIYIWGRLRYMDPTPPYTTYEPIRGAKIYMWDEDVGNDEFLDSTVSDNSGYFYFGPISSDDWFGPDIYFTFYAMNEAAKVCDTCLDTVTVYMAYSDTLDDVPPGDHTFNDDLTQSESKAFFVADVILDGYKKWKEERPNPADYPWDTVCVQLNKGNRGAYYCISYDFIYINDSIDADHRWPDTWDKHVILHEYGHRLANMLEFLNQGGAQHTVYDLTDLGTASSEGWAQFWSAFVLESPVHTNYWNNFQDSNWVNWENGEFNYGLGQYTGSANAMGKYNETATAGMFWDIHDQIDDDYSGSIDWGDTTRPHHPDNIWDTLSMGIDSILIVLLERYVNGHHPDNIDEFWYTWRYPPSLGHIKAMIDIWYEHGEPCCNTDGMRGDADGDGSISIGDVVWLVDYIFFGGLAPPCEEEGDADGSGSINVGDANLLVDYVFFDGPPPAPCP